MKHFQTAPLREKKHIQDYNSISALKKEQEVYIP